MAEPEEAASVNDGVREEVLRQRLLEARREQQRGEEEEERGAKRPKLGGGSHEAASASSAHSDQRESSHDASETPTPQPSPPRRAAAPLWSALRRSNHPSISASRSIYSYERLNHIQEGTYGVVFRARPRDPPASTAAAVVAVKKLKLAAHGLDHGGFPITSLREIQTLSLASSHSNVVKLHEVCVGKTLDQVFLVMEFMEHDLKSLLTYKQRAKSNFAPSEVKTIMYQLLQGVAGLHAAWIVHRDLKSSNLLMDNRGRLKVGDFGLARRIGDPVDAWVASDRPRSEGSGEEPKEAGMTDLVVTLWYRAPELLLLNHIHRARESWTGSSKPKTGVAASTLYQLHSKPYTSPRPPLPLYDEKIDIWSVGCIFAELLLPSGGGLFEGKDEADQLRRIERVLGRYNTTNWPDVLLWQGLAHQHRPSTATSAEIEHEQRQRKARLQAAFHPTRLTDATLDLLFQLLQWDPKQRIGAKEALQHAWFWDEKPSMAHPESFGSFPSVAAGETVVVGNEEPSAPNVHAQQERGKVGNRYPMEFDFGEGAM